MNIKFQKVVRKKMVGLLLVAFAPAVSYANGFSINVQSASGAGTGEAGRASTAADASVIYGNPAGLVRLDRPQFTAGFGIIKASLDISNSSSYSALGGATFGTHNGNSVPTVGVPFSFLAYPLTERMSLGLGIYVPFGLENNYEPFFQGRYHGVRSKVSVITVQPTISFKVTDKLSFGIGPTINRVTGHLKNSLDTRTLGGADAILDVKGADSGAMGFNAGLMYDLTNKTTVGVTYHSRVNYKLTGRTKLSGLTGPLKMFNAEFPAKLDIVLPESIDFSITQGLTDKWAVYGGATWTRWSQLQSIDIENQIPLKSFKRVSEKFDWRNTWAYAVGASYQLNKEVILRTGFTFDSAPTTDKTRNVRIPVANRKILALGAGWTPAPDWTFDAAYTYLWENEARITQPASGAMKPSYNATYKNRAHGVVVQVTKRF